MTNVVDATINYSEAHGTDATTVWTVTLATDVTLTGVVVHIEGDIYAIVKKDSRMFFFDAEKVIYMRVQ